MFPILFAFGPVVIYTANVLLVISWCIYSFLFWRYLRAQGVLEERIFDLTFYSTIAGLIGARLGFVFLYPSLFTPSLLLVGAFWVQPGLWLYAGLLSVFFSFFLYSKRATVRLAQVFDAFIVALPWVLLPITLGSFFAGAEAGKETAFQWGVRYSGLEGLRHPVQLYDFLVLFVVGIVASRLMKRSLDKKWDNGLVGTLVLVILTPLLFALEFLKVGPLYLYGITINQWILILIFAESFGMVFTKGRGFQKIMLFLGGMYERTQSRVSQADTRTVENGAGAVPDETATTDGSRPVSGS